LGQDGTVTDTGRTPAPGDGYSETTYHRMELPPDGSLPSGPRPHSIRPEGTGNMTVTRALLIRSRYFSKLLAHKVISASQADGARESGLTALIWNQVMSYGSDAMITVALAGTVFFSAPSEAQRGNVLLYLLMTMAPFAVVAPFIGPALDRYQHGRRLVMAATAFGRALLAVVMALNFDDLLVLFPAALGSLVLSKAYAVIRAAAAPRLVPSQLTLVEANARLSIFGLAAALVGGGVVGGAIKITGSYPFGLFICAAAFAATGFYAVRLPRIVDSLPRTAGTARPGDTPQAPGEPGTSARPAPKTVEPTGSLAARTLARLVDWSRRGFTSSALVALQGESTLRWLSGFLTLFLAFYVQSTSHGWQAAANLGAIGAATGVGTFLGTGIGTRLHARRPDLLIVLSVFSAAVTCLVAAIFFNIAFAVFAMLLSAMANSLSKLALDSIIQSDVGEQLRSSAFARSETFLQLSWVLGATIALLLPSKDGALGLAVAATVTGIVTVVLAVRDRAARHGSRSRRPSRGLRR
jgi:MFS family permease